MIAHLYEDGSDQFARMLPKDVVYKGDNPKRCFTIDKNDDAGIVGHQDHKYWVVGSNGTTVGLLRRPVRLSPNGAKGLPGITSVRDLPLRRSRNRASRA